MRVLRVSNGNESGSVIVIVMIVLALLTVIGISATNMSNVEQKISGNDKNYKIVFYHAESGNYSMTKWVTRVLDEGAAPDQERVVDAETRKIHRFDLAENETATDIKDEVYGYDDAYDDAADLTCIMTSGVKGEDGLVRSTISDIEINLDRLRANQMVGGGAEFGTGAAGIGERAAVEIPYWFTTTADGPGRSKAAIMSKYTKLLGVPGGL